MKFLRITPLILLVFALLSVTACGKRSRTNMAKPPPPSAPQQDFSTFAYTGKPGQGILMSDYMLLNTIPGNVDEKRVYAQMTLFFIKAQPGDKSKTHQFQLFYREFVTCKNGPTPKAEETNISRLVIEPGNKPGEAQKKGGTLNLKVDGIDFGKAVMKSGKTKPGATLTFSQNIFPGNLPTPVILNFKKSSETLAHYQGIKDPDDANMAKAIQRLDCSNIKVASPALTIPYGPDDQSVVTPENGKSNDEAADIENENPTEDPATKAENS